MMLPYETALLRHATPPAPRHRAPQRPARLPRLLRALRDWAAPGPRLHPTPR